VKSSANGQIMSVTSLDYNTLRIVHLYGTPYEMGYAQGTLLYDDIHALYPAFMAYLESQIAQYFDKFPKVFHSFFFFLFFLKNFPLFFFFDFNFLHIQFSSEVRVIILFLKN
jgi:hypothetical protein